MSARSGSHRVELACPDCGHVQSEPALVVSTRCRSCGAHYHVVDGKPIPRARPATHFTPRATPPPSASEPEAPKFVGHPPPAPVEPPKGFAGVLDRLKQRFNRTSEPRAVICFDCHRQHLAVAEAQSSQCPGCGAYISLQNYEINDRWNKRIRTRGDVLIAKNAAVSGVPILCHNLTVLGELAAAVECSGDLVIRSHGRIPGNVHCHTLRVERGARVDFLHGVHADRVFIDGEVTGQIQCTGAVTLEKSARLRGHVRASRLVVKKGATHSGVMEIVQPAPAPN